MRQAPRKTKDIKWRGVEEDIITTITVDAATHTTTINATTFASVLLFLLLIPLPLPF